MSDEPGRAHRELREQLGVYALGHGTPEERAAVRAHLDGCASCRAELSALAPLAARLDRVDPDRLDETPAPPPGLGDAVLARIAAEAGARRSSGPRRRRVLAAAAAVGVAAAGFGVGWLARPGPDPPLEAVSVQVTDPDIEATADVIPHTWGVEVRLSGTGFTAGAAYSVAVTRDDGRVVPAGEFLAVGPGRLDCNPNLSVLGDEAGGFTVVDAEGTVVLSSDL